MFKKIPMPTKKELSAMSDEVLEQNMHAARAALQEAKQLAKQSTEQERVFGAFEKEQKHRAKSALQAEVEESKK